MIHVSLKVSEFRPYPKFKFDECLFTLHQDNPQQQIYQT